MWYFCWQNWHTVKHTDWLIEAVWSVASNNHCRVWLWIVFCWRCTAWVRMVINYLSGLVKNTADWLWPSVRRENSAPDVPSAQSAAHYLMLMGLLWKNGTFKELGTTKFSWACKYSLKHWCMGFHCLTALNMKETH